MIPHNRKHVFGVITLILALFVLCLPGTAGHAIRFAASSTEDLTPREKELIQEINALRADPAKYAIYLEQTKKYYKGRFFEVKAATATGKAKAVKKM